MVSVVFICHMRFPGNIPTLQENEIGSMYFLDLYTCLESRSSRRIEFCRQIEINLLLGIAENNIDFDR
jgi:hypothetical protein